VVPRTKTGSTRGLVVADGKGDEVARAVLYTLVGPKRGVQG
jgi:hypothetical protein